jgi:hypothetical protein
MKNGLEVLAVVKYRAEHALSTLIHQREATTCTQKFRDFTSDSTLPSNTAPNFSDMTTKLC